MEVCSEVGRVKRRRILELETQIVDKSNLLSTGCSTLSSLMICRPSCLMIRSFVTRTVDHLLDRQIMVNKIQLEIDVIDFGDHIHITRKALDVLSARTASIDLHALHPFAISTRSQVLRIDHISIFNGCYNI